jgi:hypothetical protein
VFFGLRGCKAELAGSDNYDLVPLSYFWLYVDPNIISIHSISFLINKNMYFLVNKGHLNHVNSNNTIFALSLIFN